MKPSLSYADLTHAASINMSKPVHPTRLLRRFLSYYLLFVLTAFVALIVGLVWVSEGHKRKAAINKQLVQLAKTESRFIVEHLCNGELQLLAERLKKEEGLAWCALVNTDGTFAAHSDPLRRGETSREPLGERVRYGAAEKTGIVGKNGCFQEYTLPLKHGGQEFGQLRVAFKDESYWSQLPGLAAELPLAILLPMILLIFGGVSLKRLIAPTVSIQTQLSDIAVAERVSSNQLQPVAIRDSVAVGWNRLVDHVVATDSGSSLDERLKSTILCMQNDRSERLLDSLPEGIAETDFEGRLMFINNAMAALLGVDSESEDVDLEELLQHQSGSELLDSLFDPAEQSKPKVVEVNRNCKGSDRVLRIARHPIKQTPCGAQLHQAWSIRDVTQLKLADQARDSFLDTATHELRTPLANIKAYAETLAENDFPDLESQKEFCNIINSEATRLARFIDELLDISSIEAGSLSLKSQRTETDRLLDEIANAARPQMEQKNITFDVAISDKLPEMRVDKEKISTCLLNLLGNAAKYTPDNGHVSLKANIEDGQLIIDVVDTGLGIDKLELPKVFDKFFRSDDERVHEQSGTGLGLAYAKEVARLHGGTITAESELNRGSRFTISLPIEPVGARK